MTNTAEFHRTDPRIEELRDTVIDRGSLEEAIAKKAEFEGWSVNGPEGDWFPLVASVNLGTTEEPDPDFPEMELDVVRVTRNNQSNTIHRQAAHIAELVGQNPNRDPNQWHNDPRKRTAIRERNDTEARQRVLREDFDEAGRYCEVDGRVYYRGAYGRLDMAPASAASLYALKKAGFRPSPLPLVGVLQPGQKPVGLPSTYDAAMVERNPQDPAMLASVRPNRDWARVENYWKRQPDPVVEISGATAVQRVLEESKGTPAETETVDLSGTGPAEIMRTINIALAANAGNSALLAKASRLSGVAARLSMGKGPTAETAILPAVGEGFDTEDAAEVATALDILAQQIKEARAALDANPYFPGASAGQAAGK